MERREFFRSLIAGGATVSQRPERRNRRVHHEGTKLYHGPLLIPEYVAGIVAAHPAIKRTTHGGHLVSRYADAAYTWLFRCQIPESRAMVGEIVCTPEGKLRIHCWSAARPGEYREPAEIVAAKCFQESAGGSIA